MSAENKFIFRRAEKEDIKIVIEMIQELADFEKMSEGPQLTEEDLIKDSGLADGKEKCHTYVLQIATDDESTKRTIIGYSICFLGYSTWQGKVYYLEDIYVRPEYRGLGAGGQMFREIALKAMEYNCKRVDFHVLAWNPARNMYDKLGAQNLTELDSFHFYRLPEEKIEEIVKQL